MVSIDLSNVSNIKDYAFNNCIKLESIGSINKISTINNYVFDN